ncbi:MAG: Trk system potassium transporter TrkA [Clostridia bacterium]|nr:Trk system potassium transporter TrkA [Clostridia bacterium]
MKIIVAGCGKIGTAILADLVAEGHDVTALDESPELISEITNIHDVMAICGNCADCYTLEEAGIADTDMFVAATDSDELNMLSCFLAKRMGAGHTIARIRNPEYNDSSLVFMRKHLELAMALNPEQLTAGELFNVLKLPAAVRRESFSRRRFEVVEFRLDHGTKLHGLTVQKMREKYNASFLICTVRRGDKVFIPHGGFVLESGDKIGVIAAPTEILKFLRLLGEMKKQAKSIIILGGSRTAYYLAKMCTEVGMSVKIIEKSPERCIELSTLLPKAVIIQGDGATQEILIEEGLRDVDAFVCLTGQDEENILVSMFATTQKVPKVMTKVNRDELISLASKIGLDCIVSPKELSSGIVVRYARAIQNSMGSNVETLYKIMDGMAEALEFKVGEDFPMIDVPLKDIRFKPGILIAGILRDRKTIIPTGDDRMLIGDRVVVIAAEQRLKDLSDIIK